MKLNMALLRYMHVFGINFSAACQAMQRMHCLRMFARWRSCACMYVSVI